MPPELEGFSEQLESCLTDPGRDDSRARVVGLHPADALLVDVISGRSSRLTDRFGQVVILTRDRVPVSPESIRVLAATSTEQRPREPRTPAVSYSVTGWGGVPVKIGPDAHRIVEIPPLQAADEEQMRRGQLDTASPAGKALGWVARDLTGLKVGIAVGGGAARGFALVGVLDALRRAGVTADYVAGTSIGAAIGAAYALGCTPEEMTAVIRRLGGTVGRRLAFPAAILSSAKLRAGVRAELGERLIEELPIPFVATATDLVSGEQVKFVEGPLWRAVMASTAVPGTFPPQLVGGRLLVDGSRRRTTAQALAVRSRIVLASADGLSNSEIAEHLGISRPTVTKWRNRFARLRLEGLLDEPRPGRPRTVTDDQVERIVITTLESKPRDATHWSTRSLAAHLGVTQDAVWRTWQAFGLQPHRQEKFKLSTDPQFVEKVYDICGLYLNPPERAVVLCVDEETRTQ
jgi:predicted acylesterase/phospholipase RssA